MKWVLMMPDTRHPAAGDLLDHQRIGQQRLAQAAVLLVDHQPEHAELLQPRHDLVGVLVLVIELGGDRDDLGVHEVPYRGEDVALSLGQAFGLCQASHRSPF